MGKIKTNFNHKFEFRLTHNDCILKIVQSMSSVAWVNCCLLSNTFPDLWEIALATPLSKVDQPTGYKDLRPISILSPLSKLLERVVSDQIKEHLELYNILPQFQSGFRCKHSCSTALTHIIDDIYKDKLTALLLLDYTKSNQRHVNYQIYIIYVLL